MCLLLIFIWINKKNYKYNPIISILHKKKKENPHFFRDCLESCIYLRTTALFPSMLSRRGEESWSSLTWKQLFFSIDTVQ